MHPDTALCVGLWEGDSQMLFPLAWLVAAGQIMFFHMRIAAGLFIGFQNNYFFYIEPELRGLHILLNPLHQGWI